MPSPGAFYPAGHNPDRSTSSHENYMQILNLTRQNQCAKTMLEFEKQKKLKSNFSKNPVLSQQEVNKPSNALQLAESKLTASWKENKIANNEAERKINLSAEMSNPPMRYAFKQPLSNQDISHANDSVALIDKKIKFAINTDLLP